MFNASQYVHYTPDVNVKVLSLLWSADGRDRVPGPVQGRVQLVCWAWLPTAQLHTTIQTLPLSTDTQHGDHVTHGPDTR